MDQIRESLEAEKAALLSKIPEMQVRGCGPLGLMYGGTGGQSDSIPFLSSQAELEALKAGKDDAEGAQKVPQPRAAIRAVLELLWQRRLMHGPFPYPSSTPDLRSPSDPFQPLIIFMLPSGPGGCAAATQGRAQGGGGPALST